MISITHTHTHARALLGRVQLALTLMMAHHQRELRCEELLLTNASRLQASVVSVVRSRPAPGLHPLRGCFTAGGTSGLFHTAAGGSQPLVGWEECGTGCPGPEQHTHTRTRGYVISVMRACRNVCMCV